ncbi:PglL family O-oligosaccharyltransferase [Undibacterium fentianense]|uniref:O-antigen ligase C-terminal domain-containing protein n=1 Tax=Undibacterium fentianense TaxID=2828728 RepID=A0A941IEC0_9BURK|nr:O-antigen ligase family protein [Undibacterium fentianense]MBR7800928.1 O-antigen ligase C-terminal domain-containing protein [Undibacterium fentianense]
MISIRHRIPMHAARALLALMLCVPFLLPWHTLPIPSFYSEVSAGLFGLMATAALLVHSYFSGSKFTVPVIVTLPCALLLVLVTQWQAQYFAYVSQALMVAMYLVWSLFLLWCGHALANWDAQQRGYWTSLHFIACAILFGGVVSALLAFIQFFGVPPILASSINQPLSAQAGVFANIAQQNHFASYLALAQCALIYLVNQNFLKPKLAMSTFLWLGVAMILSASRSVYLYWIWIGLLYFTGFVDRRSRLKKIGRRGIGMCVLGLLCLWGLTQLPIPQFARVFHFSETVGTRFFLWQHAWQMFLDHPLLGVGFDGFAYTLIQQIAKVGEVNPWGIDQFAHNLLLQILAVSGIVGLLSFILPLGRFVLKQRGCPFTPARRYLLCSLGILAIHSLLEQPLFFSYFLGVAALMLGYMERESFAPSRAVIMQWGLAGLLIFSSVLLVKTIFDYVAIEKAIYTDATMQLAHLSEESYRQQRKCLSGLNQRTLLQAEIEALDPSSFVADEESAAQKLRLNQRLLRASPVDEVMFRQAALLAENRQLMAAKAQMRAAMLAYPTAIDIFMPRFIWLAESEPDVYAELTEFAHQQARVVHLRSQTLSQFTP